MSVIRVRRRSPPGRVAACPLRAGQGGDRRFPRVLTVTGQHALTCETVRKRPKITMNARFKLLKPAARSRQTLPKTGELETGKCPFRLH
jgi:hypothetical protein